MHIIDRYLLRQFMQNLLICFFSLMGLFVVIDAFTHLGEFLDCGRESGGIAAFMIRYYAYQSLGFFDLTASMLALMSAMFTISWIQRHNEMTALMAAGVGTGRIVAPVILAAIAVVLVAAANREFAIPKYRDELARRPGDLVGHRLRRFEPRRDNQTDILLSGENSIAKDRQIVKPEFSMPAWLREYGKQLTADNAYYLPREGERPAGYLLENVREPKNLDAKPSLFSGGQPILVTYRDAPDWLKTNQCFLVSNLDFDQLTGSSATRDHSSVLQLIERLHNPSQDFGSKLRVLIHMRIVHPLIDITLLFLGLPLIITRESRNVFIAMGLCTAVTTAFMGVVLAMQWLGDNAVYGVNPALAAWAPLIVFVPIAVALAEPLWS